jgi:chromate transporter
MFARSHLLGNRPVSSASVPDGASLRTVGRDWGRIGVTGFGGPPAHIALLRKLMVDERGWMTPAEMEDAIAACNLLPGPASTQLAMFCAGRVAGVPGVIVGGLCFICPAVVLILALSLLFLAHSPPAWVRGAGAGAGAAVAAVAVQAAVGLLRPSWARAGRSGGGRRRRWIGYVALGGVAAALIGPYLVLVLLACGVGELVASGAWRTGLSADRLTALAPWPIAVVAAAGGFGGLAWVAFKVGALSYGGGFVIVPLMQHDAVHTYHWMSSARFLDAVALGQVTPGPVVATVAAVGYAAHGIAGGLLAAAVAFSPSFAFVLLARDRFEHLRTNARAQAFLDGAGPAAIGAILGAAMPLAVALREWWQFVLLGAAAVALLIARRGVVETLVAAGVIGAIVGIAGGAV